jgi:hypothetical protein
MNIKEDVPTNNMSSGNISGAGSVSPQAAKEYKKKNRKSFMEFLRRDK